MQAVSPLNTLARGYSITRDANGETVSNARQLRKGEIITNEFRQGKVNSRVE